MRCDGAGSLAKTAAVQALREALGADSVHTDDATLMRYAQDTSAYTRQSVAVLLPRSVNAVQRVMKIAATHRLPLHPVSTGRNWGYGTANPPRDGGAIVDMSRMCAIRSFDADLGLVTLEPGVTQGALRAWLDAGRLPFMVPATGAGPGCSIVGNALERGYGLTPIGDHFGAVTALEAVLPDGAVYRSPMVELGAFPGFKWGVGPYLDGIFSQGQAGIITSMTIALARRPERVEAFYFWIDKDSDFDAAVEATRRILQDAGSNVGGVNLMSATRIAAMSGRDPDAPGAHAQLTPRLSGGAAEALARQAGAAAWMGVGAIYGSHGHASATRSVIRRALRGVANRVIFMTPEKARRLGTFLGLIPGAWARRLDATRSVMQQGLALLEGVPGDVALPLAYWKAGGLPEQDLNPSRDGCGLLWYAPIVPLKRADARRFVDLARTVCARYGFDAPITLTSLSERSFDCTLPLLFDRADASACERAQACWDALFRAGREAGFLPYRMHVRNGPSVACDESPYWRLVAQIKKALDPLDLISPGRWSPDTQSSSSFDAHLEQFNASPER